MKVSESPSVPNEDDSRRLLWALVLGFALVYLAFLPPGIYSVDGNSMLGVAESIVTRHSIAVSSPDLGTPGPDGNLYSNWYPLLSFLAVAPVAAAAPVSRVFHVPLHYVAAVFGSVLPALFTAVTVGLVALLALQMGSTVEGARRSALAFGLGTVAMVYARTFYAEPLLALITTAALYFTFRAKNPHVGREIFIGAALAALAVLAKPTGIILGPVLSAYLFLRHRSLKESFIPTVGSVIGLALYTAYNFARFGNPLNFGQPYAFSLANVPIGLVGLIASPGRGLIWYCPPLILALPAWRSALRRTPFESLAVGAIFFGQLGLHSVWKFWAGGWSWGPRFLVPVLPCAAALLGLLERRQLRKLLVFALLGFLVNAPTLVSYYERYYAEAAEQGVPEEALLWSPTRAPLLHAWGAASRVIADARNNDVREMFRQAGTPSTKIASSRALRVIAVWWWVLPVVHIPRIIGAAVSLIMVLFGGWIIFRVRLPGHTSEFTGAQSRS